MTLIYPTKLKRLSKATKEELKRGEKEVLDRHKAFLKKHHCSPKTLKIIKEAQMEELNSYTQKFYKSQGQKSDSEKKLRLLKERNVIERSFGQFKSYRRLILRYDSYIKNYMGFWYFACIEILFKILKL